MSKKDLREKIEEHRQSIEIEEEQASRMSRSSRKTKKKQKQHKFPLMTTLTFILIGIPLMILIYVWGFYDPKEPEVVEEDDSVLEMQTNTTASASINEKIPVNEAAKLAETKSNEEEELKKIEAEKREAEEQARQDAEQQAKIAQEQQLAKEKAEAEKKKQEEAKKKTHTVQENETLYRIAMKYYNDPSAVEKIKRANGMGSDTISVGQKIIIP